MFEISDDVKINEEIVDDSIIYTIDNFYKNPDQIVNYFWQYKPKLWKSYESPTYNNIHFEDRRHMILNKEIDRVYLFLQNICNQQPLNSNYYMLCSNASRFYKNKFNDYGNNYWWPHTDSGYTAIVYFNKNDFESGTNLYKIKNNLEEPPKNCPEHFQPWRKKDNFYLIKKIKPNYNRLIFFDGLKFTHGMNVCNDRYFSNEYRFNQVFFFQDLNYQNTNSYHDN